MKRLFYNILTLMLMCSCSASYWNAESFKGDAMYDVYEPAPPRRQYVQLEPTPQQGISFAPYQRPESYYQYQYISSDSLPTSGAVEDLKYVSSTYGVWDETPVIESYVYVEYTPYISYYDPFFYGRWGYSRPYWGYPYYGWYAPIYVAPRPPRPSISRPRPNIVQRPSPSVAPSKGSSRGGSSSTRVTRSSMGSSSSSSSSRTSTTSTRVTTPTTTSNSSSSYR